MGTRHEEELYSAYDLMIQEKSLRIVPVILPGQKKPEKQSELPKFLRRLSWVIFENDTEEELGRHHLYCGIKDIPPGVPGEMQYTGECPFRGLEVFRHEDAQFFFGREYEVQELLERYKKNRFIAVLGPSGSGKSSLVQAGLVFNLHDEIRRLESNGSDTFNYSLFTPDTKPLEELAFAIRALYIETGVDKPVEQILDRINDNPLALYYIAREICATSGLIEILLVIDSLKNYSPRSFQKEYASNLFSSWSEHWMSKKAP